MTLTVGPDTLAALAARPDLAAAFPFLRVLASPPVPKSGGCGGCGGAGADGRWRHAADTLFSLSQPKQAEFKAAAGVTSVTRRVVRGGKSITQTF